MFKGLMGSKLSSLKQKSPPKVDTNPRKLSIALNEPSMSGKSSLNSLVSGVGKKRKLKF